MSSTTGATLKIEPRFSEHRLIEIGQKHPHAKFENANNLTPAKIRHFAYPEGEKITRKAQHEGVNFAQAITVSVMDQFRPTLESVFTKLVEAKQPICKFLLLGMGPVDANQELKLHWGIVQYTLARQLIKNYIIKHATKYHNYDERGMLLWEYEVVVDHSGLTSSDLMFLRIFFNNMSPISIPGSDNTYKIRFLHAPLAHILVQVPFKNAFIICFEPDNPIRQLLAERPGRDKPQAIICAPGNIDNKARHPNREYSADMSSDSVRDWLRGYTAVPFTQSAPLSSSSLGDTCLFFSERLATQGHGSDKVGLFRNPDSADSLVVIHELQDKYADNLFEMCG